MRKPVRRSMVKNGAATYGLQILRHRQHHIHYRRKTGVTRAAVDAFPGGLTGKVVGRSYSFNYGFVYGKPTGRGTLSLSSDGKSFTGMFSDNAGHKGTWTGRRTAVPDENITPAPIGNEKTVATFDGLWSKAVRRHTDCSFSATSKITFTTDLKGVTRATVDGFRGGLNGKVVGRTYAFTYGIVYGKPTGKGIVYLECRRQEFYWHIFRQRWP